MALTITRIPERYRPGLAKIISLPVASISEIANALGNVPSPTNLKVLRSTIERAGGLTSDESESLTVALNSLYLFLASLDASLEEFVAVLVGAMQASGNRSLTVPEENRAELVEKLIKLLGLKTLERASKVEQLKEDHQVVFYDAKIITDIRPVFDDPRETPIGAIIHHTLKIICHESGEHKELYFALEPDDVKDLKKVAERAELKMATLKAFIKSTSIPDFS